MATTQSDDVNAPIDDRTRRALEELMLVHPELGDAEGATGMATVFSESGTPYVVDVSLGACGCPDKQYNLGPDQECKHVKRAKIALGDRPIPSEIVDHLNVDPMLGEFGDGPLILTSDGGVVSGEGERFETMR